MKSRILKSIPFILTLALLIGVVIGVSVSAQTESTYAIKAINVSHGDRTYVLMAIDAPVDDADSIEVTYTYGGYGTFNATYWEGYTYTDSDGTEYPVFYTKGISAKDIGQDVIAEAHVKGVTDYTPDTYNVSIAEYLYAMLYREGYISKTDGHEANMKKLYLAHLEYGAMAEEALYNDSYETKRTLVTERSYVYCEYATLNSSGAHELLLDSKTADVTLVPTQDAPADLTGWTVKSYSDDGSVTETFVEGNTVAVTSHSIISPFTGEIVNPDYTLEEYDVGVNVFNGISGNKVSNIQLDPLNSANKVLYAKGTGGHDLYITAKESEENATCYLLEFDMLINNHVAGQYLQVYMNNSSKSAFASFNILYTAATTEKDATVEFKLRHTSSASSDTGIKVVNASEWIKFKAEYYPDINTVKVYINGEYVGAYDNALYSDRDDSSYGYTEFYCTGGSDYSLFLDNISVHSIAKEFADTE